MSNLIPTSRTELLLQQPGMGSQIQLSPRTRKSLARLQERTVLRNAVVYAEGTVAAAKGKELGYVCREGMTDIRRTSRCERLSRCTARSLAHWHLATNSTSRASRPARIWVPPEGVQGRAQRNSALNTETFAQLAVNLRGSRWCFLRSKALDSQVVGE
jgi:hypothetical protein